MNQVTTSTRQKVLRLLEWVFAVLGTAVCEVAVIFFASQQLDALWPAPGFYFIEIVLFGVLVVVNLIKDTNLPGAIWGAIPWVAGGVLLAFVILAGFTIGPLLFPAMLAFWLAGAAADLRQRRGLARHFGLAVIAALFQGALIFAILFLSRL